MTPDIRERAERLAPDFRKQAIDLLGVVDETPNPAACVRAISQALLEAHKAGVKEGADEYWTKPDMTDPAPDQSLEDWINDIPGRTLFVVPGVIARLVDRAHKAGREEAAQWLEKAAREADHRAADETIRAHNVRGVHVGGYVAEVHSTRANALIDAATAIRNIT